MPATTTLAATTAPPPDVPARLAGWLLDTMRPTQRGGARTVLGQSKRALAAELGTSPEALSRALARLRNCGCIAVDGCCIDVLDADGLHRVARRALPRRVVSAPAGPDLPQA